MITRWPGHGTATAAQDQRQQSDTPGRSTRQAEALLLSLPGQVLLPSATPPGQISRCRPQNPAPMALEQGLGPVPPRRGREPFGLRDYVRTHESDHWVHNSLPVPGRPVPPERHPWFGACPAWMTLRAPPASASGGPLRAGTGSGCGHPERFPLAPTPLVGGTRGSGSSLTAAAIRSASSALAALQPPATR